MLDGAAKVKPMLAEAQRLEMPAIGMTDHGNMFGASEFYNAATDAGIDVLLFSNTAKPRNSLADEVRAILVAEAEADPVFKTRIEESYKRIVALKARTDAPRQQDDAHRGDPTEG